MLDVNALLPEVGCSIGYRPHGVFRARRLHSLKGMTLGIRDGPHNHTNHSRVNTGFKKRQEPSRSVIRWIA